MNDEEANKISREIVRSSPWPEFDPNSEVGKIINNPHYIYSAEFAMKHSNSVDNGDGTMTLKRPKPYREDERCK